MSWGLSRDKIYRMIVETEKYYPIIIAREDQQKTILAVWQALLDL